MLRSETGQLNYERCYYFRLPQYGERKARCSKEVFPHFFIFEYSKKVHNTANGKEYSLDADRIQLIQQHEDKHGNGNKDQTSKEAH